MRTTDNWQKDSKQSSQCVPCWSVLQLYPFSCDSCLKKLYVSNSGQRSDATDSWRLQSPDHRPVWIQTGVHVLGPGNQSCFHLHWRLSSAYTWSQRTGIQNKARAEDESRSPTVIVELEKHKTNMSRIQLQFCQNRFNSDLSGLRGTKAETFAHQCSRSREKGHSSFLCFLVSDAWQWSGRHRSGVHYPVSKPHGGDSHQVWMEMGRARTCPARQGILWVRRFAPPKAQIRKEQKLQACPTELWRRETEYMHWCDSQSGHVVLFSLQWHRAIRHSGSESHADTDEARTPASGGQFRLQRTERRHRERLHQRHFRQLTRNVCPDQRNWGPQVSKLPVIAFWPWGEKTKKKITLKIVQNRCSSRYCEWLGCWQLVVSIHCLVNGKTESNTHTRTETARQIHEAVQICF